MLKISDVEKAKKTAAEKAIQFVKDNMLIGLGTGSTTEYFIKNLSILIKKKNLNIVAIPSSKRTERLAKRLKIPLTNLKKNQKIDLYVDGADQVDSKFNLIKGKGGAHTKEKFLASIAKKFIVIVNNTKLVKNIDGEVPIEVLKSKKSFVENELRKIGGIPKLRKNFITDSGNIILDTFFSIKNPKELEEEINEIFGVVENGIFSKRKPEIVIVGFSDKVKILKRSHFFLFFVNLFPKLLKV